MIPPQKINNNRDIYVDMTKAVAILLMVIGHNEFAYWFGGIPRNVIFSFHMPLFFVASGYMHRQGGGVKTVVKKSAQSLLKPYLLFGILALTVKVLLTDYPVLLAPKTLLSVNSAHQNSVWFAEGYTIGPIWFLVALFWGKVLFTFLVMYLKNHIWLIIPICFVVSYSAVYLGQICNLPLGLLTGMSSLIFISIGYVVRIYGINMLFMLACIILWTFSIKYPLDMAGLIYYNYPLNVLGAFGGTICCFLLSIMFVKIPVINKFVFFGRYSLYVLCCHYIIMSIFPFSVVTGKLYCTLFVVSPFLITYLTVKANEYFRNNLVKVSKHR